MGRVQWREKMRKGTVTIDQMNAGIVNPAKTSIQEVELQFSKRYDSTNENGHLIASTVVSDQYIITYTYKPGATNPSTFKRISLSTGFLEFTDFGR
jgi:hypothetical protein